MKYRTFTVLIVEEYEEDIDDDEAVKRAALDIQAGYDGTDGMLGTNFLIVKVEDGDARFWREWEKRT